MIDKNMWTLIQLEIISLCNRDCKFCPRSNDVSGFRKNNKGEKVIKKMPKKHVMSVIDQAYDLEYRGGICFHHLSEPFLDDRYISFAKYAKEKGMKIFEDTNGDVLKNNKKLCGELDGLVDRLTIGLYDYKSVEEKKELKKFWKSRFNKTEISFSCPLEEDCYRSRIGSKKYMEDQKDNSIINNPCKKNKKFIIRYDGEVAFCCEDHTCSFGLGNVFKDSIKNIWYSEKHMGIIRDLEKMGSRRNYELCINCYIP